MPGPKSEEKGSPAGGSSRAQQGHCADVANGILQSASNLCGVLVVAVVAPLCGDGSGRAGESGAQRLAMAELRRLVDQRQQQEHEQDKKKEKEKDQQQQKPGQTQGGRTEVRTTTAQT
jgi:hypothetical protein